jgi:uncharacterized protein YjbI with pentapeptide repeats
MATLRNVRGRGTAGRLRGIDACHLSRGRSARQLLAALAAVAIGLIAAPLAAADGAPFVTVHATLEREDGHAFVEAKVVWDRDAARDAPDYMTAGDLRLVAVSEDGHHPKVLATKAYAGIDDDPTQGARLDIQPEDEDTIASGNRVVLTASQHGVVSPQGARTAKTFVTVDQLQPFGSKQDRIGRRDCADVAIVREAKLNECDLTGADLDRALVSVRDPAGTRMLAADLTGATMQGADLTGLSVAGGRLNGADVRGAILDNLSLAGAEATGLDARDATSDKKEGAAGANIFDARLAGANFEGAVLNGVSFNQSRLDRANFHGATWTSVEANTASLRGADLTGLKGSGSTVYLTDFDDAMLGGAALKPADLEWAFLCHTEMPDGKSVENRDCKSDVDPGPKPVAGRKVAVDGAIEPKGGGVLVKATVNWSRAGITSGMTAGDVRAVAIDARTGLPTRLGSLTIAGGLPASSKFEADVTGADELAGLARGNRVVVTATQHPPLPRSGQTNGSYVTVDTVQPGPGRGRVGSRDCSDLLLGVPAPAVGGYNFCDLAGAVLTRAKLSGAIREADLTGAALDGAELKGAIFDAGALGGADLTGAELESVSLIGASAPRVTLPKTSLRQSQWRAANLDGANFSGDTIADSTFAASSLAGAKFPDATLGKVDLAYTNLAGAHLDGVEAAGSSSGRPRRSSLFLADLTGATLANSKWNDDESGERPWTWSTLCNTVLPADATVSGDRDCPRDPR